ncbi:GNAT family N-acetyltransferase [Hyphomonas sp.]|uniref:GNAT family N-acetyltransferase n=1 Tax=Hyphomonas sp. TaxID=87 RepID=UPI00391A3841
MKAPVLETERLRLRQAEPGDLEAAAAMWADEGVVRFIGGKPRNRQEVWFALLRGAGLWMLSGHGYWVVTDKQTGAFLGEGGFADFKRGLPAHLVPGPEAGWAFAPAAWGRGLATEAVRAMHGWLDQNLPGISSCVIDPDNLASAKVAAKMGYVQTGETLLGGERVNTYRRGA